MTLMTAYLGRVHLACRIDEQIEVHGKDYQPPNAGRVRRRKGMPAYSFPRMVIPSACSLPCDISLQVGIHGKSVETLINSPPPGAPMPPILLPQDGFLFLDRSKFRTPFAGDVDSSWLWTATL